MSLLCQLLEFNMFFCNLESFYSVSVLISLPVIQLHTPYLLNNHTYRISRCYWYAHNASICASSFTTVRTKWLVMRFFLLSEGVNLLNLILCWIGVWVCVCLSVLRWRGPDGAAHGVAGQSCRRWRHFERGARKMRRHRSSGAWNVIGYKVLVELKCNCWKRKELEWKMRRCRSSGYRFVKYFSYSKAWVFFCLWKNLSFVSS